MVKLFVPICVFAMLASYSKAEIDHSKELIPHIHDGYKVRDSTMFSKYIVSLRLNRPSKFFGDNHFCAGSIKSSKVIITAAHCLYWPKSKKIFDLDKTTISVVAGSKYRNEILSTTRLAIVESFLIHPNYNIENDEGDIALLFLEGGIDLDGETRSAVNLANGMVPVGTSCTILGWGRIFNSGPLPGELVYANIDIFENEECGFWDVSYYICVRGPGSQEKGGQGDSGGPLICNDVLTGVMSMQFYMSTNMVDEENTIGGTWCTNVSYYYDWIIKNNGVKLNILFLKFYLFLVFLLWCMRKLF